MSDPTSTDSASSPRLPNSGNRACMRYITTHDSSGKSVLTATTDLPFRTFAGRSVARAYALSAVPVPVSNDQDLHSYLSDDGDKNVTSHTLAGRQTTVPNGVNMTYLELAPGAETAMHRTVSVDFTIVLEGELEMELDGGDKVLLKPGDSVVQRATMHKWKNLSKTDTVRVVGILCACEQIEVGAKPIEEQWLQG